MPTRTRTREEQQKEIEDIRLIKNPRRGGLGGGRPYVAKPPKDENEEINSIKMLDEMAKGGFVDMTKDKNYYKGML